MRVECEATRSQYKELELRLGHLSHEKQLLSEQLQQEIESHAETKKRLAQRKQELEELLQDYLAKLEEADARLVEGVGERKKLAQNVADLTEQLEGEEQTRQKYRLEKQHFESKLKALEQSLGEQGEALLKSGKDKRHVEDKLNEVGFAPLLNALFVNEWGFASTELGKLRNCSHDPIE